MRRGKMGSACLIDEKVKYLFYVLLKEGERPTPGTLICL